MTHHQPPLPLRSSSSVRIFFGRHRPDLHRLLQQSSLRSQIYPLLVQRLSSSMSLLGVGTLGIWLGATEGVGMLGIWLGATEGIETLGIWLGATEGEADGRIVGKLLGCDVMLSSEVTKGAMNLCCCCDPWNSVALTRALPSMETIS